MDEFWTVTIRGGVKVCVEPDIQLMSTYVLIEQEDWFEAEMDFVRAFVRPGMHLLDVGANHGVYALTMAGLLEGRGRVTALEPCSKPAGLLAQGVEQGGLGPVLRLVRAALSDRTGTADMFVGDNSELGSLHGEGACESVALTTLDELMRSPDWHEAPVDFLKLDAEGEELRVLEGGREFFASHSPLVMFELRDARTVNLDLLDAFRQRGMDLYRYCPGLGVLTPFALDEQAGRDMLNLFACTPGKARELALRGLLAEALEDGPVPEGLWREGLAELAHGRELLPRWEAEAHKWPSWPAYRQALDAFLHSADASLPLSLRAGALARSERLLSELYAREGDDPCLAASLVRVAGALGMRLLARRVALQMVERLTAPGVQPDLDRPFLAPLPRFDHRPVAGGVQAWLRAAALEAFEQYRNYSSCFHADLDQLAELAGNPNHSLEMERRFALSALRQGLVVNGLEQSQLVSEDSERHRNSAIWRELVRRMPKVAPAPAPAPAPAQPGAPALASLLELIPDTGLINVLDVGASSLGEGSEPYAGLVGRGGARVIGFEPNAEECRKVQEKHGPPHLFLPWFIGDGEDAVFHETNWALTGSLYAPNEEILEAFAHLGEVTRFVGAHPVKTKRLDDILEVADVDFFKIDVQGGELNVFKGGDRVLAETMVIQTEVEFVDLYKGQPLFAEIDQFLRSRGFLFHTFLGYAGRTFKPLVNRREPCRMVRQMLWSDVVYVRDFRQFGRFSVEKLKKTAVVLHDVFQSYDLCYKVLEAIDEKTGAKIGEGLARAYQSWLETHTVLACAE